MENSSNVGHEQFRKFIAKLSPEAQKVRHKHILKFVAKQKRIAKKAKYAWSPYTNWIRVDVNQEFGREFILQETLFHEPEKAWSDSVAMREHRKNPVWILARRNLARKLRPWKFNQVQVSRLTDFAFPAAWDELIKKMDRKERPHIDRQTKEMNAKLRTLAAVEKRAQRSGNAELLRLVESEWPREVEEVWAGHCLYGERLRPMPLSFSRPGTNRKKGRPRRPLVAALRRASLTELTRWGFTKAKSTYVVAEIETVLKISEPFTIGYDNHGKPCRFDAILKSQ